LIFDCGGFIRKSGLHNINFIKEELKQTRISAYKPHQKIPPQAPEGDVKSGITEVQNLKRGIIKRLKYEFH